MGREGGRRGGKGGPKGWGRILIGWEGDPKGGEEGLKGSVSRKGGRREQHFSSQFQNPISESIQVKTCSDRCLGDLGGVFQEPRSR